MIDRVLKALPLALVIFGAGGTWYTLAGDVEEAKREASAATAGLRDLRVDVDAIRTEQRRARVADCRAEWMTHQLLRRIDPNAAAMIPEPRQPYACE